VAEVDKAALTGRERIYSQLHMVGMLKLALSRLDGELSALSAQWNEGSAQRAAVTREALMDSTLAMRGAPSDAAERRPGVGSLTTTSLLRYKLGLLSLVQNIVAEENERSCAAAKLLAELESRKETYTEDSKALRLLEEEQRRQDELADAVGEELENSALEKGRMLRSVKDIVVNVHEFCQKQLERVFRMSRRPSEAESVDADAGASASAGAGVPAESELAASPDAAVLRRRLLAARERCSSLLSLLGLAETEIPSLVNDDALSARDFAARAAAHCLSRNSSTAQLVGGPVHAVASEHKSETLERPSLEEVSVRIDRILSSLRGAEAVQPEGEEQELQRALETAAQATSERRSSVASSENPPSPAGPPPPRWQAVLAPVPLPPPASGARNAHCRALSSSSSNSGANAAPPPGVEIECISMETPASTPPLKGEEPAATSGTPPKSGESTVTPPLPDATPPPHQRERRLPKSANRLSFRSPRRGGSRTPTPPMRPRPARSPAQTPPRQLLRQGSQALSVASETRRVREPMPMVNFGGTVAVSAAPARQPLEPPPLPPPLLKQRSLGDMDSARHAQALASSSSARLVLQRTSSLPVTRADNEAVRSSLAKHAASEAALAAEPKRKLSIVSIGEMAFCDA
jgi:hypothetical protein